jgi:hypothetical protein
MLVIRVLLDSCRRGISWTLGILCCQYLNSDVDDVEKGKPCTAGNQTQALQPVASRYTDRAVSVYYTDLNNLISGSACKYRTFSSAIGFLKKQDILV